MTAETTRRLLDLAWKGPFVLASTLMVGAGAAQSLGRTGAPPVAALAALALAAVGVVVGLLARWQPRRPRPVHATRALAHRLAARTRAVRSLDPRPLARRIPSRKDRS